MVNKDEHKISIRLVAALKISNSATRFYMIFVFFKFDSTALDLSRKAENRLYPSQTTNCHTLVASFRR